MEQISVYISVKNIHNPHAHRTRIESHTPPKSCTIKSLRVVARKENGVTQITYYMPTLGGFVCIAELRKRVKEEDCVVY